MFNAAQHRATRKLQPHKIVILKNISLKQYYDDDVSVMPLAYSNNDVKISYIFPFEYNDWTLQLCGTAQHDTDITLHSATYIA